MCLLLTNRKELYNTGYTNRNLCDEREKQLQSQHRIILHFNLYYSNYIVSMSFSNRPKNLSIFASLSSCRFCSLALSSIRNSTIDFLLFLFGEGFGVATGEPTEVLAVSEAVSRLLGSTISYENPPPKKIIL